MKSNSAKITRAKKSFAKAIGGAAPMKKDASYVGELSSGHDATTPGIDGPQAGKGHQEAVNEGGKTDGGAHHDDKRDTVGRAARSKGMEKLGEALLALEKEAKGGRLSDVQQSTLAETFKQLGREFDKVLDRASALEGEYKNDAEILVSANSDWVQVGASAEDSVEVEAAGHPLEDGARIHTKYEGREVDEPSMAAEQWFDVGPGTFKDPRDEAEKATAKSTADHFS